MILDRLLKRETLSFTPRAKTVLKYAETFAQVTGFISTFDLLRGIFHEPNGVGHYALENAGLTEARLNGVYRNSNTDGEKAPTTSSSPGDDINAPGVHFSMFALSAIAFAAEEAKAAENNHIGTEHLLLGILRDTECDAAHALRVLGVDAYAVREFVMEILGRKVTPAASLPEDDKDANADEMIEGLLSLVASLSGDAIGLVRERDAAVAEAEAAKAELVRVQDQKSADAEKKSEAELREQARNSINIVFKWLNFVRYSTNYTEKHQNFPTDADFTHSSLLFRMMMGQEPLPKEEYETKKKQGLL
jgi:ATP-dependent Clp protease ATP-binding subunit ClpA